MKMRTLFLGSAAALVTVVGGAQAADLSVAEPVESVRVCDAFGTGYWYIPGTQTCIKVGGSVEFTTNFHALSVVLSGSPNHSSNWDFVTEAKLNFTAKSVTDYGDLVGYVGLEADYNNNGVGHGTLGARQRLAVDRAAHGRSSVFDLRLRRRLRRRDLPFGHRRRPDPPLVGDGWLRHHARYRRSARSLGHEPLDHLQHARPRRGGYRDAGQVERQVGGWRWPDRHRRSSPNATKSVWGVLAGIDIKLDSIAAGDVLRIQGAYGNASYTGFGGGNAAPQRHLEHLRRSSSTSGPPSCLRRSKAPTATIASGIGSAPRVLPAGSSAPTSCGLRSPASAPSCRATTLRFRRRPASGLARSLSSAPGKFAEQLSAGPLLGPTIIPLPPLA